MLSSVMRIEASYLVQKQVEHLLQPFVPLFGDLASSLSLETICQLEQLVFEMVDCKAPVVQWTMLGQRVFGVVESRTHTSGNVETARRTHHADGVQPVRILKDFGFQRFGRDIG